VSQRCPIRYHPFATTGEGALRWSFGTTIHLARNDGRGMPLQVALPVAAIREPAGWSAHCSSTSRQRCGSRTSCAHEVDEGMWRRRALVHPRG
jgi:hypothetical protein